MDSSEVCDGAVTGPADGPAIRDQVLTLTSSVRVAIDHVAAGLAPPATLSAASVALAEAGAESQLAPLRQACERFHTLAAALPLLGPGSSASLLRGVGVIERVLDGCLEGMGPDGVASLGELDGGREIGLEDDLDAGAAAGELDLHLDAAPDRGPDWGNAARAASGLRTPAEQELFDAFAAETLDVLDRCEDALLRAEATGDDVLSMVESELAVLCDAAAAVDLDLDAPAAPASIDEALEWIDAARHRVEEAWADAPAAVVDPAELLAMEEVILRLRRAARDVAHRQGTRVVLEAEGGEVRLSAALAERIFDPLVQLVSDAASHAAPDSARTLRLYVERDGGVLSVTLDEPDAAGGPDADRAEALHWIDARAGQPPETDRLVYRPGAINVVQILTGDA